jgi:KipI family sensor histidine kinase inhibitor
MPWLGLEFVLNMKAIPYGPNAVLIQLAREPGEAALARCLAFVDALEKNPPAGLTELTPGLTTLLVEFNPKERTGLPPIGTELLDRLGQISSFRPPERPCVQVPVNYDGQDLERVARLHELTTAKVIELHAAPLYRVAMIGFSPGFPYLEGLDARLHTPRLDSPRPRVPAGSVGIGSAHAGIYPMETPGGWNIIGHTDVKIFDPERGGHPGCEDAMFLLRPGDRVKFIPQH